MDGWKKRVRNFLPGQGLEKEEDGDAEEDEQGEKLEKKGFFFAFATTARGAGQVGVKGVTFIGDGRDKIGATTLFVALEEGVMLHFELFLLAGGRFGDLTLEGFHFAFEMSFFFGQFALDLGDGGIGASLHLMER